MAAGRRDLGRTLGRLLAFHVAQIWYRARSFSEPGLRNAKHLRPFDQGRGCDDLKLACPRGFRAGSRRANEAALSVHRRTGAIDAAGSR
jgi:hypothetical protein